MTRCVAAGVAAVHALGAFATSRTFFQPDEYWQTLEIAHRIVFGYGYATWEWSGTAPVRSVVHPALYVPLYVLLGALGADTGFWMVGGETNPGDSAGAAAGGDRDGGRRVFLRVRTQGGRAGAGPVLGRSRTHTAPSASALALLDLYVDAPLFEQHRGGTVQHRAVLLALDTAAQPRGVFQGARCGVCRGAYPANQLASVGVFGCACAAAST